MAADLSAQAPVRLRSRIEAMLGPMDTVGLAAPKPLRIVWVYSTPAEGVGYHDFQAQMEIWKPLFAALPAVTFTAALKWPSPDEWKAADIVVFNFRHGINTALSESQYADLDAYFQRGKALIPLHVCVAFAGSAA